MYHQSKDLSIDRSLTILNPVLAFGETRSS